MKSDMPQMTGFIVRHYASLLEALLILLGFFSLVAISVLSILFSNWEASFYAAPIATVLLLNGMTGIRKSHLIHRAFKDTATSKLPSAAQGFVELEGKTQPFLGEVDTPFGRHDAVAYVARLYTPKPRKGPRSLIWSGGHGLFFCLESQDRHCVVPLFFHLDSFSSYVKEGVLSVQQVGSRFLSYFPNETNKSGAPNITYWRWMMGNLEYQERILRADIPMTCGGVFKTVRSNEPAKEAFAPAQLPKNLTKAIEADWAAYCRRIEGIESSQRLQGLARIHVLTQDPKTDRHLFFGRGKEPQAQRGARNNLLKDFAFVAVGILLLIGVVAA